MRKNWLITISVLLLIFSFAGITSADILGGTKKNVATSAWYHESVAQYGYTSYYDEARTYWNKMNSKAFIGKKTSGNLQKGEDDQYYINSVHPTRGLGLLGATTGYKKTLFGYDDVLPDANWDYATVVVYEDAMKAVNPKLSGSNSTATYSRSSVIYNMAHEIGHSLKLNHPTHTYPTVLRSGLHLMPSSPYNQDKYELTYKWGSN